MRKDKSFKATFGPGIYFIGDPCYALKNELYDKWVNETDGEVGNYDYFAVGNTAYGDGTYEDTFSRYEFSVDAGIIGVVNMNYSIEQNELNLHKLGKIINISKELIFEYDDEEFIFIFHCDSDERIEIHMSSDNSDDEDW